MLLGILFCTCLIVSNLMAAKIFVVGDITLSAAVLLFPVSYILNDCIAEVWGYRKARFIIWTGFAINFLVMGVFQLAVLLHMLAQDIQDMVTGNNITLFINCKEAVSIAIKGKTNVALVTHNEILKNFKVG